MKTGISWLDFKLGARMLMKYPGLTLVGGMGMAVAIAIGAITSEAFYTFSTPSLPLDGGDRVVGIESRDTEANRPELRTLHDFAAWREELRSIEELGAFATVERNLIAAGGPAGPVNVAEMTASGFRVARVPPLMGRHLVPEDEREGAPPVVVIGYDAWRNRFAGDRGIVGREVRLGNSVHTVVGVMPEDFSFPMNHGFWVPLRARPTDYERREGPELYVFGRLAPGVDMDEAQAELTAVGRRTAAAFPRTHERILPRVVPYTGLWFSDSVGYVLQMLRLLMGMLLVMVCVNIAILVYARTAARMGEISVRNALGASRSRIVTQLFVEALVLSAGAAVVGLVIARLALKPVNTTMVEGMGGLPFWVDFQLSPGTLLYVLGLVIVAAVIVGVLPAMKATGRQLQSSLRELGSGGGGGRLGGTWTALIVAQVAFAVAVLPRAVLFGTELIGPGTAEPGFAAEEFLTSRLDMDRESPPSAQAEAYRRDFDTRFAALQTELVRRLRAEPGVSGVTFASGVPGAGESQEMVDVDGASPSPDSESSHKVRSLRVDVGFFEAFGVATLTGRGFNSGDADTAATSVIVNRSFVQQVLGGGNALGRRVRYVNPDAGEAAAPESEPWYVIVGVVDDLPPNALEPRLPAGVVYHPLAPGQLHPVSLAVRLRGGAPVALAPRLREITTSLDPTLRADEILALDEFYRQDKTELHLVAMAITLVTLSVLFLSAAGIYALMSVAVTQRRREIGIRSALGAHPRQIITSIFSRALRQLVIGVVVGIGLAVLLEVIQQGGIMDGRGAIVLPGISALMLAVGLLAAAGPARRALRVQPTEALRDG